MQRGTERVLRPRPGALRPEVLAERVQAAARELNREPMQGQQPAPQIPVQQGVVGNQIIQNPIYGKSTKHLVKPSETLKGVPIDYRNGASFEAHAINHNAWAYYWKSTEGLERTRKHQNLVNSYAARDTLIINNSTSNGLKTKAEIRKQWMENGGERVLPTRGQ
jgi:hypothetical protein